MKFELGGRLVGDGEPCYVVAEIGSNHDGDLDKARRMVEIAADQGADAVKFQTFEAKRLYPRGAGKSDYLGLDTDIYDIIEAMEMPAEWLEELAALARSRGLGFLSSPFHPEAVEVLRPHVDAYKVASYEMTHEPLLRAVAAAGQPVIISTGTATFDEVRTAVDTLRAAGVRELIVLQCTACYPAPPESVEVAALVEIRERLGVLSGLSDHSLDAEVAPAAAAALGACMVEKHYTLSKQDDGPDHAFAVEPEELGALVRAVRQAETVRGSGHKRVHPVEAELREFARRSIFTTGPIRAGEAFSESNVDVLRQGKLGSGLEPAAWSALIGSRAARDLEAAEPLQEGDVEWTQPRPAASAETPFRLRPAEEKDLGTLWVWGNDPQALAASTRSEPFDFADHERWFRARLRDARAQTLIAERGGNPVAVARLDPAERAEGAYTVSINVDPGARGMGVGRKTLEALSDQARRLGATELHATILPVNQASRRCFEAVGYRLEARQGLDPELGRPAQDHFRLTL
ncbi:MAG: GNAT family N-acetyltransferase [Planctomycetota bacterium]